MGLIPRIKRLFGLQATAAAAAPANPDDLFGMSTAAITMEATLGFEPTGDAGLCFAGVESTRFEETRQEVQAILDATAADTGTVATYPEDDHGYQWIVLTAQQFEDLVTGVYAAADTFIEGRFGSRLLATLFAFEATERASAETGQRVYWVYSFRRGTYYPFAPVGVEERDERVEFKLQSVLDGELTVEDDREYWYPLWPDVAEGAPWE